MSYNICDINLYDYIHILLRRLESFRLLRLCVLQEKDFENNGYGDVYIWDNRTAAGMVIAFFAHEITCL